MAETNLSSPAELAEEGRRLYGAGDYAAAAGLFENAAAGYRAAGQAALAAEMANNLSVAQLQAGDPAAALAAVAGTAEIFAEAGDRLKMALAWGNQAAALEGLGHIAEAEQDYERSAAVLKELGENDLRAEVMKALTALQVRGGRQMEALASMQSGLAGVEKPGLKMRFMRWLLNLTRKFLKIG